MILREGSNERYPRIAPSYLDQPRNSIGESFADFANQNIPQTRREDDLLLVYVRAVIRLCMRAESRREVLIHDKKGILIELK